MLIKPAILQAAIIGTHNQDACVHVPDPQIWSKRDEISNCIRCVLTRWRELAQLNARLDSVLSRASEERARIIMRVCSHIKPHATESRERALRRVTLQVAGRHNHIHQL